MSASHDDFLSTLFDLLPALNQAVVQEYPYREHLNAISNDPVLSEELMRRIVLFSDGNVRVFGVILHFIREKFPENAPSLDALITQSLLVSPQSGQPPRIQKRLSWADFEKMRPVVVATAIEEIDFI